MLNYGQETGGIDITLVRVRKVRVRGRILNGISGETVSATIALQRLDANNTASLPVAAAVTFDSNRRFDLEDITPGAYVIWAESAEGGRTLVGHAPLTVGEADIDNVELTIQGDHAGTAVLIVDGGVKLEEAIHLRFEPRNERGRLVDVPEEPGGEFRFSLMGDDHYDPFVTNLPNDFFLSAVLVNGVDTMPQGIDGVSASLSRPFELVLDSHGARVSGRVMGPDDSLWSRASVALIPDPARGRVQSYREGSADENGLFLLRGVAPGKYILVAWLDEPPCDYYDPDGLNGCRAAGLAIEVQQAGEQNVELKMKVQPRQ
jgi:hypothetical protein